MHTNTTPRQLNRSLLRYPTSPISPTYWGIYTAEKAKKDPYLKDITVPWKESLPGALTGVSAAAAFCLGSGKREITGCSGIIAYLSLGAAIGATMYGVNAVMATLRERAETAPLTVAEDMLENCSQIDSLAEQAIGLMKAHESNKYAQLNGTLGLLKKAVEKTESENIDKHRKNILKLRNQYQEKASKTKEQSGAERHTGKKEPNELKTNLAEAQQKCSEYLQTIQSKAKESKEKLNQDIIEMKAQIAVGTNSSSEVW